MVMLTGCIFLFMWFSHAPLTPHNMPTNAQAQLDRLNINEASAAQLGQLPGIGPKLAESIVKYRTENGAFTHVGDLCNVPGIGSKKLESIAHLIYVGG